MALTKQKLLHKRSSVVGRILAPSALTYGEIAVNFSSGANNSFLEIKKYDDKPALYFEHPYGAYSTTISGSTNGYWSANISGVTEYYDGLSIYVRMGTSYDGSWNTLNVNGLGSKIVWFRYNGRLTSHYAQWSELRLTYRTAAGSFQATATARGLISGTTYKDGWVCENVYDSTDTYTMRPYYAYYRTDENGVNAYNLCALDVNERLTPLVLSGGTGTAKPVNRKGFRPDKIYYASISSRVAANTTISHAAVYESVATTVAQYTFNASAPAYNTIYLKGKLNADDGLFYLSSGTTDFYRFVPYTAATPLTLTDYFEEGWYYIRVGRTYSSANYYYLDLNNPLFYFDGTNLIEISPLATMALSGGTALSAVTSQSAMTANSAGTLYNWLHIYQNGSRIASFNGSGTTSALTTDNKVYQSNSTTSSFRPIMLGYQTGSTIGAAALTAATTQQVYTAKKVGVQPSTGKIVATGGFALSADTTNVLIGNGGSIEQDTLSPAVSVANSGSTNSAAQSVVYGAVTGGTKGHSVTLLRTNKIYSASTADSATTAGKAISVEGTAGTADAYRNVWFSWSDAEAKRATDTQFQYNPAKNAIKVSAVTMNGSNIIQVPNKAGTFALTSDIDNALSSSVNYKGATSTVPASASTKVGDLWIAASAISLTAAQSATGAAQNAEIGDFLIARTNNKWDVVQKNIDGAVTTTADTLTDGNVIVGKGNRTIGVSSYTIAKSVPANAVFTDTATTESGHYSPTGKTNSVGVATAGSFLKQVFYDSKGHVTSATTGTALTSFTETQLSYSSGSSVSTAASSVMTGLTVSNHAITYGKTNKIYSATTADSARTVVSTFKVSSAATATNLQHPLHIYENGTRVATYSGGTIVSALTKDEKVKASTATTKAYILGHAATASTATAITHANTYISGGAVYSEGKIVLTGVTAAAFGSGVVTGVTVSGTSSNRGINLTKTTAVKINSATTADIAVMSSGVVRTLGETNVYRDIWFSHATKPNHMSYDDDFQYNPATNLLKVSGFTNGTTRIVLPASSGTLALEEDIERLDFMLAATANDLNERKLDKADFSDSATTYDGHYTPAGGTATTGARITGITLDGKGHVTNVATAATDNVDEKVKASTATTKAYILGHAATASTATAITHANTYISGGAVYSEGKIVLTGATGGVFGSGAVTGITVSGTAGNRGIALLKTTGLSVTCASTAYNVNGEAGTVNQYRNVWFSDSSTETKRNSDTQFQYNPGNNSLKVSALTMSGTNIIQIPNKAGTMALTSDIPGATAGVVGTGVVTGLTACGTTNHTIVGLKTNAVNVNSAKTTSAVTIVTLGSDAYDQYRTVWFSHGTYPGIPVRDTDLEYNPQKNLLKVSGFTNGTTRIVLPQTSGTIALTSDIDNALSSSVNYKGATAAIPASASTKVGDMYIASTSITLTAAQSATGAAQTAETGDFIIARANNKWDVIQKNLDGAVTTTATTLTDGNVIVGKGNRTIGVSSYTIAKSVPSNAIFTDSATTETGHYTPSTTSSTLGSTSAGNFIKTISLDSKKHVVSITSGSETQLSYVSGTSVGTAAASVVTGITVSNHAITYGKTNKVYSASTADSARTVVSTFKVSSAATATNLQHQLHIYQNGTRIATYSGGTIVSARTSDSATTYAGHYTPSSDSTATTSGARITGITKDGKGHIISIATAATDNTDTKVTDANSSGKTFLLGHATQGTNATAQTYTNVYMSAGTIAATEYKVEEKAVMKYNTTNQCIDFVFI